MIVELRVATFGVNYSAAGGAPMNVMVKTTSLPFSAVEIRVKFISPVVFISIIVTVPVS